MIDTPTDPAAIDLEPYKARRRPPYKLIAAVEALRERVAELEKNLTETEAESEHYLRLAIVDPGANDQMSWKDRVEAVEARVAELTEVLGLVLEEIAIGLPDETLAGEPEYENLHRASDKASAVLAATPAEALERTRTVEDLRRAEGYVQGLTAAAKCASQHGSTPGRELAETIRALAKLATTSKKDSS